MTTTSAFGTLDMAFTAMTGLTSSSVTNTCPGTFLAPGNCIAITIEAQTTAANGEVSLLTLPASCMVTGQIYSELYLSNGGYMNLMANIVCNSGLSQSGFMSNHSAAGAVPTGLAIKYGSPSALVLGTSGPPLKVTGGLILLNGLMWSNP